MEHVSSGLTDLVAVGHGIEPPTGGLLPRGLMGLVARDLLLELVDQPLERFHLQLAEVFILVGFRARLFVAFLQEAEFPSRVRQLSIVSEGQGITSTIPLEALKRPHLSAMGLSDTVTAVSSTGPGAASDGSVTV